MRFGILGPLRVGDGDATITAGRERVVLAMLLLRANRVVPVQELIDAVWDDRPPATARGQLQTCVSRLRQRLAELGVPADVLITDPIGYGIRVEPDQLDAELFASQLIAARTATAAGRTEDARRSYRTALALWRGPALSAMVSPSVRRRAQHLDEQRLAALEECVDLELRLGLADELIDELTDEVERHPLRERLRGQLMLALCAVGRQVDALATYRVGRRIYADELGIEPGTALQELHQRVLAGDLANPASPATARPETRPVRCLPRAISDFTGRQKMVTRLVEEIEEGGARLHLIDGMPGSGKTTLAVHVATALTHRYSDAQLFIDLHGHSERSPLTPAAALATLLRQLGVAGERIPADADERVALWRSELAGRPAVVVVLDNAASAAQVAPLLTNDCLTLVTSRRRLVGLDGARPRSLAVLDRVAGHGRVAAEPDAAAEVVRRCGYLPLAIRLAGARLAHRPRWRIADLVDRLNAGRFVLMEITAEHRSVADAFELSYAQVSAAAQRTFRLLGLHPGELFDHRVAAALTEQTLSQARDLLDELVDVHLVEEPESGRFRFHDLMREYARLLLDSQEDRAQRLAALTRLLDHHLQTAASLVAEIEPKPSRAGFILPEPARPDLVADCRAEGLRWFDHNGHALLMLVRLAEEEGLRRECWQLARAAWFHWFRSGHLDELIEAHTAGLRAAERLGDPVAEATMRNYLASAYYRLGRYAEAIETLEVALTLHQRLGDRLAEGLVRRNLGSSYASARNFAKANEHFEAALALARAGDVAIAVAPLLNNQAFALLMWGRYAQAQRVARLHLALAGFERNFADIASALEHLGTARSRMGDHHGALRRLQMSLRLRRRIGDRYGEVEVLDEIGIIERILGRPETAAARHREALAAVLESGDRIGACATRNLLARALLAQGYGTSALDLHRRVLHDATRLNSPYEQARALDGMARCVRSTDPTTARSYWARALALFRQIGAPEQEEVKNLLAELGSTTRPPAGAAGGRTSAGVGPTGQDGTGEHT